MKGKTSRTRFAIITAIVVILLAMPSSHVFASEYISVVNGRDDGVWLFPVSAGFFSLSDWAGCSNGPNGASNPCIFDGLNHYSYGDDFHRGTIKLGA